MLAEAVTKTPLRLWGDSAGLLKATSQFIDSEVNVRIDDQALLKQGIVDRAYVGRVKSLLPAALRRLVYTRLGLAFLVAVLSPTVIFLICHFTGLREMMGSMVFVPSAVAAIALWVLLESRMHKRLRVILNDAAGKKVPALLRRYHILWMARGVALALTAALLSIAAVVSLP